eukprot:CAMPEP_0168338016 /NCGR_PEP_ID=MMETSP0213-20121227/12555_1 /TAXON_ID=151035 /ORGANISM="Euplotes harpa, Strain FSP1.4" /LENGTH=189 /DNA_ID=CAMNT_0008343657 /DNA_START=186 /DNA_END=755 /DNA_ORIENTATION=-
MLALDLENNSEVLVSSFIRVLPLGCKLYNDIHQLIPVFHLIKLGIPLLKFFNDLGRRLVSSAWLLAGRLRRFRVFTPDRRQGLKFLQLQFPFHQQFPVGKVLDDLPIPRNFAVVPRMVFYALEVKPLVRVHNDKFGKQVLELIGEREDLLLGFCVGVPEPLPVLHDNVRVELVSRVGLSEGKFLGDHHE